MTVASRFRHSGSLGEPRPSFNYLSLSTDDRTWTIEQGQPGGVRSEPTVLIADDDDDTRRMFRILLESKGYRVVEAGDGEEALKITVRENPGLLLLDLGLPRLNGLHVIRALRNKLKIIATPVVVITGNDESFQAVVDAGCDDYLLKPVDFGRLESLLDYYVPLQTQINAA